AKRWTHARLTPNVAATSSASPLVSQAFSTRSRKSIEYGAAIIASAGRSTMAAVLRTSRKRSNDGVLCEDSVEATSPTSLPRRDGACGPALNPDLMARDLE